MSENYFNGLPQFCYATDPYSGTPALLYPGDSVFYSAARKLSTAACKLGVEGLNALAGVAPAQAAAMRAGVQDGWGSPRANPARYDARGVFMG